MWMKQRDDDDDDEAGVWVYTLLLIFILGDETETDDQRSESLFLYPTTGLCLKIKKVMLMHGKFPVFRVGFRTCA